MKKKIPGFEEFYDGQDHNPELLRVNKAITDALESLDWPSDTLTELLKLAEIPNMPSAQGALCAALGGAKELYAEEFEYGHTVKQEVYERIERDARSLIQALNALRNQRGIGWKEYFDPSELDLTIESLDDMRLAAECAAGERGPGQPAMEHKLVPVRYAMRHLYMHSPTVRAKGRLSARRRRDFIELFYETVTGEACEGLDHQMRIVSHEMKIDPEWRHFPYGPSSVEK